MYRRGGDLWLGKTTCHLVFARIVCPGVFSEAAWRLPKMTGKIQQEKCDDKSLFEANVGRGKAPETIPRAEWALGSTATPGIPSHVQATPDAHAPPNLGRVGPWRDRALR